ncbi:response regulator transcription factor [Amycolatopsis rhabdoformis]|uniref:Response regulator transcription factor n=1 Tax=Amycolatopsis rhabdoformis TaxID=1448059 RepID=A0ABZ1IF26_9PSEU|nr:response regulator transcription factor [Amycolatopsis rhabdoformis]WSE32351.1 response regulator transcription factor [Amycolatopsis rhabdoformis]
MIRVVVVDDQSLIRVGLETLLSVEDDITLVGQADNGESGFGVVRRQRPDVVLLDIRMPGWDGLEVLRRITADPELDAVRVVMLTTFEMDDYIFEALRSGASGFVLKDTGARDLLHAIRVVAAGESLLSPSVTRRVIDHMAAQPQARPHPDLHLLTERERQIAAWVATGASNDEIAAELVLSPATVRTHIGRAMIKLNARDRAQLVVFTIRAGLTI